MRRLELGMIVRRDGILYEVVGTSDGPVAYLHPVNVERCEHCGRCEPSASVVDSSPLAREYKSVPTPRED